MFIHIKLGFWNMKKRNSNFELMRIVSMFFIVLWHIIMHGNVLNNCANPAVKIILEFIMFIIIIHVNSFVMLSGYFQSQSKFKLKKVISLLLQVSFYSLAILVAAIKLGWIENYTIVTFINNTLLTALDNYWFIKMYLVTYVFSDYINKFIDRMSRCEYKNFLLIVFVMLSVIPFVTGYKVVYNDGYNFSNFIYLYMIGAYLRKYPLKETYHFKCMSINGYRMFLLSGFFIVAIFNYLINHFSFEIGGMSNIFNEISNRVTTSYFDYSTPLVIIQTILYFELFKTLKIENSFINKISKCVFGIYLIHDNPIVRTHIYKILKIDNGLFYGYSIFLKIIIVLLSIFIGCFIIDFIRDFICKKLCNLKIIRKSVEKFKKFISSFNFNINW